MKVNQLKAGSMLSYVQMAMSIIVGLLYTPVMTRMLGQSEYGLYQTVTSTVAMLSVLSLGFNGSYIRYYSRYKQSNDEDSIYRLNGLFIIIFSVIGLVALCCGLFLSQNLTLVFADGLTAEEYRIAKVLMILLTVNLSLSFPMSVFSSIISAHERYVFLKLLGMLKTVGGPLVTLPLLLMGFRSIAMVAVTLAVSLITDITYFIFVRKVLKNRFYFSGFPKGLFKELFVFTIFIALNLIVDQVNSSMGNVLLGRFRGTASVSIFGVGYTLYQYYIVFSTSVSNVFSPRIHRIVNETKENLSLQRFQLSNLFTKVGRIQFMILGLIASGFAFFGKPFVHYWAGKDYGNSYWVALLLMVSASIALIENLGIEIQRAQNLHKFRSIVYIFMALLNLGISVVLAKRFGAIGCAVGTAFSLVVANGLIMNIYYQKKCNIDILGFWKSILRLSVSLILPIAVGSLMMRYVDLFTLWKLFVCVIVYAVVYSVSVWFVGMNRYEKDLILKPLKKILRKF